MLLRGSNPKVKQVRTEYKYVQATAAGTYNPKLITHFCIGLPITTWSESKSCEQMLVILALQSFCSAAVKLHEKLNRTEKFLSGNIYVWN